LGCLASSNVLQAIAACAAAAIDCISTAEDIQIRNYIEHRVRSLCSMNGTAVEVLLYEAARTSAGAAHVVSD
jgi:hypothetical protein